MRLETIPQEACINIISRCRYTVGLLRLTDRFFKDQIKEMEQSLFMLDMYAKLSFSLEFWRMAKLTYPEHNELHFLDLNVDETKEPAQKFMDVLSRIHRYESGLRRGVPDDEFPYVISDEYYFTIWQKNLLVMKEQRL